MEPDEFLAWERVQHDRHAYVRGHVFALGGGSPRHSLLASRMIGLLGRGLRGTPCDVHTSNLRLGIDARHFAYADVAVACRPLQLRAGSADVVTNPSLIVEVLSKTTEAYDRGDKQAGFLALPTVKHYVLISQREARVELYTRQTDGSFRFTVHGPGTMIELEKLKVTLAVDDIYAGSFELPGDDS
jgi:Uma2 family endonuclease